MKTSLELESGGLILGMTRDETWIQEESSF
jgi:hypothetical protein